MYVQPKQARAGVDMFDSPDELAVVRVPELLERARRVDAALRAEAARDRADDVDALLREERVERDRALGLRPVLPACKAERRASAQGQRELVVLREEVARDIERSDVSEERRHSLREPDEAELVLPHEDHGLRGCLAQEQAARPHELGLRFGPRCVRDGRAGRRGDHGEALAGDHRQVKESRESRIV